MLRNLPYNPNSQMIAILFHICLLCGHPVGSARILGMFPFFGKSHHRFLQAVMKVLAGAGHEVVVYSPFSLDHPPPPNYTEVYLDGIVPDEKEISQGIQTITNLPHWKCLDSLLVLESKVNDFYRNPRIKELLEGRDKFDLIITESFTIQEYTLLLGHVLKLPIICLHTIFPNSQINFYAGNTLSLTYTPDTCSPYSDRMSFSERLVNSYSILRGLYVYHVDHLSSLEHKMRKVFPDMPSLSQLTESVALTFTNSYLTTDYSHPLTPNIVPVGGIHISEQQPLPQNIKEFMDGAPEGVIFFSLGSYVPDNTNPKEYFDMYIRVFKNLQQKVLWKTRKENIEGLPGNVMTSKWLPQVDILAHPNCALFITHGGLHSQHETIHFGVPVVVIPQFFDQHRNARFYVERRVGVKVENSELTETSISAAIHTVLDDHRYRENMKRLSRIYRDRPLSPAESVVFWTEYVLRHGGAGHLKPASTQLSWYQLALLDVVAAFLLLAICTSAVLYVLSRNMFFAIRSKTKQQFPDDNKKCN